jgi:hypothetical protein
LKHPVHVRFGSFQNIYRVIRPEPENLSRNILTIDSDQPGLASDSISADNSVGDGQVRDGDSVASICFFHGQA